MAQIRLSVESRSLRIQEVMAAIDSAAGDNPAPDLVVLPGGYDGLPSGTFDRSMIEAIASKAREWGVLIVIGTDDRADGGACARLFDADGDQVACTPDSVAKESDNAAADVAVYDSLYGTIGIVNATSIGYDRACKAVTGENVVMAVPIPDASDASSTAARRNIKSFLVPTSSSDQAHWAIVVSAGRADLPRAGSVLWAPGGTPLGEAEGSEETIVSVDVPISP